MLRTYWITFRLCDDADYQDRYDSLIRTIRKATKGAPWEEPTSFIMFQSDLSPDALRNLISLAIDQLVDVVVLAHVGYKEIYVIGYTDKEGDLKRMVPYLK